VVVISERGRFLERDFLREGGERRLWVAKLWFCQFGKGRFLERDFLGEGGENGGGFGGLSYGSASSTKGDF
jgi:hypothetical protein